MSGTLPGETLTVAELVDLRRFCGYPPGGGTHADVVARAAARLVPEEIAVARIFLGQLRTLEAAVPAAGDNLDTDQAAVWTRNRDEVRDREALLRSWSGRLCAALGIQSGPMTGVGAPVSAAFVV